MSDLPLTEKGALGQFDPPPYDENVDVEQQATSSDGVESNELHTIPLESVRVNNSAPAKNGRRLNKRKLAIIIALVVVFIIIVYIGFQINRAEAIFRNRCRDINGYLYGDTVSFGKVWMIYALINFILIWFTIALFSYPTTSPTIKALIRTLMIVPWFMYTFVNLASGFILSGAYDTFNGQCFSSDSVFAFWMILGLLYYILILVGLALVIIVGLGYFIIRLCTYLNPFE